MDIQKLMKAAVEARKSPSSSNSQQQSKAKNLEEAIIIARKKFLSEYPEARNPRRLVRPSKQEQEKEAKEKRKRLRKEPMSSEKNSFSSSIYSSEFARPRGARDKKKRKKRKYKAGAITKGLKYGAMAGAGLTLPWAVLAARKNPGIALGTLLSSTADKAVTGTLIGAGVKGYKKLKGTSEKGYFSKDDLLVEFARPRGAKDKKKRKKRKDMSPQELLREDEKLKYAIGRGAKYGGLLGAGTGAVSGGLTGGLTLGPAGVPIGAGVGAVKGAGSGALAGGLYGGLTKRAEKRYRKKLMKSKKEKK